VRRDKFKPENILRYSDYLARIKQINPLRLKFVDEKSLKGVEIFNRKARADPLTGFVPITVVDSDFRNTYAVIGMMGFDNNKPAIRYSITKDTNDATDFFMFMLATVGQGYCNRGDVIVMDNAAIHVGGDCEDLREMLWNYVAPDGYPMMIEVLFLPTRSPELNPIELVWNTMVERLKTIPLNQPRPKDDVVAFFAAQVLDAMDHALMKRTAAHCGYNVVNCGLNFF
jgi:transposase